MTRKRTKSFRAAGFMPTTISCLRTGLGVRVVHAFPNNPSLCGDYSLALLNYDAFRFARLLLFGLR